MASEADLVAIGPGVLYDVGLKTRLELGRWDPEGRGNAGAFWLKLYHDPEIEAGNLKRPLTERERARIALLGPITQDWAPFRSPRERLLVELPLEANAADGRFELRVGATPATIALTLQGLAQAGLAGVSDDPAAFLVAVLAHAATLGELERTAAERGCRQVAVTVDNETAAVIGLAAADSRDATDTIELTTRSLPR